MRKKILLATVFSVIGIFFLCQPIKSSPPPPPPDAKCDPAYFNELGGVCVPKKEVTGLADRNVSAILLDVLKWILYILGFLALLSFVISGTQYVLAQGDKENVEKAKKNIQYSIMGVAIALSSLIILRVITRLISGPE